MITNGFIEKTPVFVLIDDGAEINYISSNLCDRLKLPLKEEDFEAVIANITK